MSTGTCSGVVMRSVSAIHGPTIGTLIHSDVQRVYADAERMFRLHQTLNAMFETHATALPRKYPPPPATTSGIRIRRSSVAPGGISPPSYGTRRVRRLTV